MALIDFLKSVYEFGGINDNDLNTIAENSEILEFGDSAMIQGRGDIDRYLWVVYEGKVEVVLTEKNGLPRTIATMQRGEIFGEMSLMTGEPAGADIKSSGLSKAVKINRDIFTKILFGNPSVLNRISKTITKRLIQREKDLSGLSDFGSPLVSNEDIYDLNFTSAKGHFKILVINSRMTSVKYALFDTKNSHPLIEGLIDKIGTEEPYHKVKRKEEVTEAQTDIKDTKEAIELLLSTITSPSLGLIKDAGEIDAVGHRVVHGGDKMFASTLIDDSVEDIIRECSPLAPLHNPYNLEGIRAMKSLVPNTLHIAVFDTAFHSNMPEHASAYSLPQHLNVKRYGFHGINHNYVMLMAATHLKRSIGEMKIVSCHLGNGSSLCAIDHGRSIDTSMGMTPSGGSVMGSRTGDLDPGILIYLMQLGFSPDELHKIINRESGIKGISGISGYVLDVLKAADEGSESAKNAITMFCYSIKKYIGSYIAALGGIDVLIFTGGVGENSAEIRARVCHGLEAFGIYVFDAANRLVKPYSNEVKVISEPGADKKIIVVPSDDKRMIARETLHAVERLRTEQSSVSSWKKPIPVNISAHHVHVNEETFHQLFGKDRSLTPKAPLSQPGQFASEETVNLIGPKGRVDKVRILGPYRKDNQVEISRTEEFKLGIDAPIRDSGDIEGTPGIVIEGPAGPARLENGVICARRHIHMSPEDALGYGLRDRDVVMVKIKSQRELIFGDVLVRVHPSFKLDMHIDTDEGNAAEHIPGTIGFIEGIQSRAYM